LGTTRQGRQDYSKLSYSTTKYSGACRMDLPRPTALGGYQDRLLGGPLGLLDLCHTVPDGVGRKYYGGEVLR
jgi:hypothetical protein